MADSEMSEKLEAIKTDVLALKEKAAVTEITDADTEAQAIDFIKQIKVRTNRIDELRLFFVRPLNTQVGTINGMFKAQIEPLEEIEKGLKAKLKIYVDEQDRIAREQAEKVRKEQEAAAEKLRKKNEAARKKAEKENKPAPEPEIAPVAEVAEAPKQSTRTESGALATIKKVWKWKVTDYIKLRIEHPDLFVLDEKAVNKLVADGERDIPGVEIYQESQIAVR